MTIQKVAIALATVVLTSTFASFAYADRVSARFEAGLVRQAAAPAEGSTGGTGGTNGGESGGNGAQSNDAPQDPNVNGTMASDMLDEFIEEGPNGDGYEILPNDTDVDEDAIEDEVAEVGNNSRGSGFILVLNSALSRFRSR